MWELDLRPWILLVQIWWPDSTRITTIYQHTYASYHECWQARAQWPQQTFTVLCVLKGGD